MRSDSGCQSCCRRQMRNLGLSLFNKLCFPASLKLHPTNATGTPFYDFRPGLLETLHSLWASPILGSVTLSSYPCLFSPTRPTDPNRAVSTPTVNLVSIISSVCVPGPRPQGRSWDWQGLAEEEESLRAC